MFTFTCNNLRLRVDHLLCGTCLPLLQLLPDAGDHTQAALQSVSHLSEIKPNVTLTDDGSPVSSAAGVSPSDRSARHFHQTHDGAQSVPGSPSLHHSPLSWPGCRDGGGDINHKKNNADCTTLNNAAGELPDLSRKRPLGHFITVLGRDADLGVQTGPSKVQVDGGRGAHHL